MKWLRRLLGLSDPSPTTNQQQVRKTPSVPTRESQAVRPEVRPGLRGDSASTRADQSTPARIPTPKDGQRKRVIIGLDFGTSSTKAVVQIRGQLRTPELFIVGHDAGSSADPEIVCPSAVAIDGDRLYFGWNAEQPGAPQIIRSFKMCLACLHGQRRALGVCHSCDAQTPGQFSIGGAVLDAEDISALYLAHYLQSITKHTGVMHSDDVFINTAAPLDQLKSNAALKSSFARVIERAFQLWPKAENPWLLSDAMSALSEVKSKNLPPVEERRTAVFPETLAAMTAFLKMPGREKGNYASLDVGAGTTDVAFFWFHKTDGDPEACYYAAATYPVGMDDIDASLIRTMRQAPPNPRKFREGMSNDEATQKIETFRHVLDAIYRHYRMTWGQAYENCKQESAWVEERNGHRVAQFQLCLVGGGAKFVPLVRRLSEPFNALRIDEIPYGIPTLPARIPVLWRGRTLVVPDRVESQRSLLLLALGLSEHAIDIPRYDPNYRVTRIRRVQMSIHNPDLEDENTAYTYH
jgi:hypothetical protein